MLQGKKYKQGGVTVTAIGNMVIGRLQQKPLLKWLIRLLLTQKVLQQFNCLLPITPEKMQIKINNANDTLTLINEGEINILKTPELTDVEFECRIPQVKYPFAAYKSGFRRIFLCIRESWKIPGL